MTTARIVFMGAKGGVGATTCAINYACASAREGAKTVLCDWDGDGCGDVSLAFGDARMRSVAEVHENLHRLSSEALYGFCRIHSSGVGGIRRDEGNLQMVDDTCHALSSSYDIVIIDAGHRLDALVAREFERATHFVLVVTPEIAAIRAAQRLLEEWRRIFVPRQHVLVLYNRHREAEPLSPSLVKERLGLSRLNALPDAATLHSQAWRDGVPAAISQPAHPYVTSLADAMRDFLAVRPGFESGAVDASRITGMPRSHNGPFVSDDRHRRVHETVLRGLHKEVEKMGMQLEEMLQRDPHAMRSTVESIACSVIDRLPPDETAGVDRASLLDGVLNESVGLGPLEPLLADSGVSEVMVNGPDKIFVERGGRLAETGTAFSSDAQLRRVIERIVARVGRRIDESSPMVDARLPDGSRVNVIIPPLSLEGPVVTIRRFPSRRLTMDDLCSCGSLSQSAADCLKRLVAERRNVIVSGGTGSGKTTLLNVLSAFIPCEERIITIEDAAELQLVQSHVVRLEARQPNVEGKGAVAIRDLVRNALRMRPDRIIVGECRGGEALDMLQAMNTGHEGSLTTVHANSPRDCIARLETLVMFAGMDLPSKAIREQIVAAIHYVIQLERRPDGRRIVSSVERVVGLNDGQIMLEVINVGQDQAA